MQYLQKSSLILHSNRADKSFNASTCRLLNYTNQMLPFIYLRLSNFAVEKTGCKTKNDYTCVWRIKTLCYQKGLTVITFITLFDWITTHKKPKKPNNNTTNNKKNKTRRTNNTTIIILSCTQPTQYSFSSDMFSLCDVRVQTACNWLMTVYSKIIIISQLYIL